MIKRKSFFKKVIIICILVCFQSLSFTQNTNPKKTDEVLLYYWHFNDLEDSVLGVVESDFSMSQNANIQYLGYGGGYMDRVNDGTSENAVAGFEGGYALRVRNPSNLRDLIISMPTTEFENIVLSYAVKRTTNGQTFQTIYYSTSETEEWTVFESNIIITENYRLINLDFSDIPEVSDNPHFTVRIVFGGETITGIDGNNRFDNIKLKGTQKESADIPPYFTGILGLQKIIESGENKNIDLNQLLAGGQDVLEINVVSSDNNFVVSEIDGNSLFLIPVRRGDANITIFVNDGINPVISQTFRVLVYPQAHNLSQIDYSFTEWSSSNQDYEYPDNMIFLQTNTQDPDINYELLFPYFIPHDDYNDDDIGTIGFPYNNTRRTRINGLGNHGMSFINTGRDRDLGGVLLAINTKNIENAYINWIGETIATNERNYGIRLQYRIGIEGNFTDLIFNEHFVEYLTTYNGHEKIYSDIELPAELLDKEYVQLLWKYFWIAGNSGSRAELRLDNIIVKKDANFVDNLSQQKISIYPNPATDFVNIETENRIICEIYNSLGQKLIETKEKSIDISYLSPGLYTVLVKNNNGELIVTEKLIIK